MTQISLSKFYGGNQKGLGDKITTLTIFLKIEIKFDNLI